MAKNLLHWADYLVFIITLVFSLGVGVFFAITNKGTNNDYLMGSRQLKMAPVAISVFMSLTSSILILGLSAEMYMYGSQLWMEWIPTAVAYAVSAYLFTPMMYRLRLTSLYTYHRLRYGSRLMQYAAILLMLVGYIAYMGLALFAPSTALEGVTGFPTWASYVCCGVVGLIYTSIGGIKAVVWTDFFQGIVMFVGLLVILIVGSIRVGGIDKVWEVSGDKGRLIFFNMDPDPTARQTFTTILITGFFASVARATEQTNIQRYSSLPNIKHAIWSGMLQIPLDIILHTIVCLCGLVVFAYYEIQGCDPVRSGQVGNINQLLPFFLVDVIAYPGLTGLFIAVLFSGALSSVTSIINSLTAVTWKDFLEPWLGHIPEKRKTLINKFTSVLFGGFGIGMAFAFEKMEGHVLQISGAILGGLIGPGAAIIIIAALFPCVHWTGGLVGLITGLGLAIWMNIGQYEYFPHRNFLETNVQNCSIFAGNNSIFIPPIPDDIEDVFWLYKLSYHYVGFIGFVSTTLVMLLMALVTANLHRITGSKPIKSLFDDRTVVNLSERCGCCCSSAVKKVCQCWIDFDAADADGDKTDDFDESEMKVDEAQLPEPSEGPPPYNDIYNSQLSSGFLNSAYAAENEQTKF